METKKKDAWGLLLALFLGQLVAFIMASTSFASSLVANGGVDAPLTQSFFMYLLLALVYGPILLCRRQKLGIPWYWYLALAVVDVQGNYLGVQAYQYSSITSITLLDCCAVVWAIILTWYALGTRYSCWQLLGAGICVAGLGLVLLSDAKPTDGQGTRYSCWQLLGAGICVAGLGLVLLSDAKPTDQQDPGKMPLVGDALVIAGTVCFALANVGEEYCVKKNDRVELVAMLGLFGLLVNSIEIFIFERKSLEPSAWSPTMISLFAGYAVAVFIIYSITPIVLKMSGSTLFNLSLLTSDLWAIAIRVLYYQEQIKWLYYVAFTVVAIGLIIYSLNDNSTGDGIATSTQATDQYQQLPSEDNSTGSGSNLDSQGRKQQEVHIC